MRTLHKGLAMLLVVIMVLGLGAFTAVAAPTDVYADADQISEIYKEAVDVFTYIGVLEGDNGFRPKDTLTRAEGAKILAAVMGNLNPVSGTTSFTDVDDWAKGYVAYVEANGISDGVAENLFGSQMKLTGSMFAKWLLVGLGYNAEAEGMTGAPWEINIAKLVRITNLDNQLEDYDPTAEITREQAAQMALNALKTPTVEYDNRVTITSGAEVISVSGQAKAIISRAAYAQNISSNTDINDLTGGFYVELGEQYWRDLKLSAGEADDLGRPTNYWTYSNKTIGEYTAVSERLLCSSEKVGKNTLYNLLGKSAVDDLTKGYYSNSGIDGGRTRLTVYIDGVAQKIQGAEKPAAGAVQGAIYLDDIIAKGMGDANKTGSSIVTELYKLTDVVNGGYYSYAVDDYILVITNPYLVKATADYSASAKSVKIMQITENGQDVLPQFKNEIKQSDFDVEDVKKDDYLIVTWSNKTHAIQSVEPATVVTGEVESFTTGGRGSLTLDGTTYKYNGVVKENDLMGSGIIFSVGSEAVIVLDTYGYIIAVDDADANASWVYIQSAQMDILKQNIVAQAYFLDGTSKVITVKKAADNAASKYRDADWTVRNSFKIPGVKYNDVATNDTAGHWFKYTVDDNGNYTLTDKAGNPGGNDAYTTGPYGINVTNKDRVDILNGVGVSAPATSNTILILRTNTGSTRVYEGIENIPTIQIDGPGAYSYTTTRDGNLRYVFIDGTYARGVTVIGGNENKDMLLVLKANGTTGNNTNNERYVEYDVVLNGESKKLNIAEGALNNLPGTQASPRFYTDIHYNSKGWVDGGNQILPGASSGNDYSVSYRDATLSFEGNTLTITNGNGQVTTINTSNANLNLIIKAGQLGTTGQGYNTDYVSHPGSAIAAVLDGNEFTGTLWATYSGAPGTNGTGKAKAVYLVVDSAQTAATVTSLNELQNALRQDPAPSVVRVSSFTNNTANKAADIVVPSGTTLYLSASLGDTTNRVRSFTNYGSVILTSGSGKIYASSVENNGTVTTDTGTVIDATNWDELANTLYVRGGKIDIGTLVVTGTVEFTSAENGITIGELTISGTVKVETPTPITVADLVFDNGTLNVTTEGIGVTVTSTVSGTGKLSGTGAVDATDATVAEDAKITTTGDAEIMDDDITSNGRLTVSGDETVVESISLSNGGSGTYTVSKDAIAESVTVTVTVTLKSGYELSSTPATATASGINMPAIAKGTAANTFTIEIDTATASKADWTIDVTINTSAASTTSTT